MRMPRSLVWRIALAYTTLILIVIALLSTYLARFANHTDESNIQRRVEHEAALVSDKISVHFESGLDRSNLIAAIDRLADITESKITVSNKDGEILADTWEDTVATAKNTELPEFDGALATGQGHSARKGTIMNQEVIYATVPIQTDGGVVGIARVAIPISEINSAVSRIIIMALTTAAIVILLSIGLAYIIASRISKSILSLTHGAHKLTEGKLDHRVTAIPRDETEELSEAFNKMASTMRKLIVGLSAERDKLSAILETMADGIIVIGPDGFTSMINHSSESLLDVDAKDAIGRSLSEVIRDHELAALASRALSSRTFQQAEIDFRRQNRFISAIATPLNDTSGEGVLLTLHDLTEVRRLNTTRREFVSNVSHELRNPLASIKALVDSLRGGALETHKTAQEFIERINTEVDRMTSLVNDLLELSRLESGFAEFHPTSLDLPDLVEEAIVRIRKHAEDRSIELTIDIQESLPRILGEEDRLHQVMLNLLDNSLKATPDGGGVSVGAHVKNNFVEVTVIDTGIGIAVEHLPHIFERFYKVDRSRRDGGTGLGLAIVKHIVQVHGGDVGLSSEEGNGSSFSFTLPVAPRKVGC